MSTIPLTAQLACVKREVAMRKRVYPRWIATGKMTKEDADRQTATMEAVAATLEDLVAKEKEATQPSLGI